MMREAMGAFRWADDLVGAVDCVRRAAEAGDDEIAHAMQDELVRFVVEAIARDGMPGSDAQAMAAAVAPVYNIEFSRWCA